MNVVIRREKMSDVDLVLFVSCSLLLGLLVFEESRRGFIGSLGLESVLSLLLHHGKFYFFFFFPV